MKRKAQFLDKAEKDRLRVANGLLRSFCKGWGGVAKQRWGGFAKVGTNRKGWGHFAKDICVRSKVGSKRKRTAEAVLCDQYLHFL